MSSYRNPNKYYGSAMKRRPRKVEKGFFSNIGNALSKAHDWIRSNKIISSVSLLGKAGVPYAGAIGTAAGTLGYGRRRRAGRPRVARKRGGAINLRSLLSNAHKFVKDKKLISSALSHFGHHKLSSAASSLGYGRRRMVGRPRVTRKRKVGGANLRSLLSSAHKFVKDKKLILSALSNFGHHKLSSAVSNLGYGKKRRVARKRVVRRGRGAGNQNFFSTQQLAVPKF